MTSPTRRSFMATLVASVVAGVKRRKLTALLHSQTTAKLTLPTLPATATSAGTGGRSYMIGSIAVSAFPWARPGSDPHALFSITDDQPDDQEDAAP